MIMSEAKNDYVPTVYVYYRVQTRVNCGKSSVSTVK